LTESNQPPDVLSGVATVATARDKFHCPACGGEAHWTPTQQALLCPFCGTESPAVLQTRGADTVIVEHDLAAALRAIPDEARGWLAEKRSVKCQSCQAISVFDASKVGQRCDFCGSVELVPYEQIKDVFRPESLLPFRISETQARELIRNWYRHRWFAPNTLRTKALTDTAKGIYLPYWTFDAKAEASWTADSGRYTDRDKKHVRRAVARVRRRARWGIARSEPGILAVGRAVSHELADSLRSRLSRRMDR
jgi:Zn finger protein HypA/HybF involved in hydrogenase expression